jgi:isoleucyl-tRNA synthetase
MQRMMDLHVGVQAALKVHNTGKALQLVNNCVANDLSALYYDCIKDTLFVLRFFTPSRRSHFTAVTATRA